MASVDEALAEARLAAAEAPLVLTGRSAILAAQARLQHLAAECGQAGAADTIDYFLTQPYTGGKTPHLLLFQRTDASTGTPSLQGAVLVHQYRWLGMPLGVFVTEDSGGERNVLGPAPSRSVLALRAAKYLLQTRRAHLVMLSLQSGSFQPCRAASADGSQWALVPRTLLRRVPLLGSYGATLDTLGAHTRRNFRLYRRRALAAHGCVFLPRADLSEQAFIALNARCDYPVPLHVAQWRYRSVHTVPGGVLAGVRTADGDWISMVGGRRSHGTFAVDWQMNNVAFSRISPATLMRGYLMEHEAAQGMSDLLFQGGTPHSMQSAFRTEHVVDLVGSAGSVPAALLRRMARSMRQPRNVLLQTLAQPGLCWHADLEA